MARPIKTTIKVETGFSIKNCYTTGNSSKTDLFIDDIVSDLQYVEDQEVKTISTGRVTAVSLTAVSTAKSNKDIMEPLANRITVNNVTIDHSEENHSLVDKIPANEILEYFPEDEIKRVEILPILRVILSVTLSDGTTSTMELREGDTITNAVLLGKDGDVVKDLPIKCFVYTLVPRTMALTVTGIVLDDGVDTVVDLMAIKSCGVSTESLEENSVQEAIDKLASTEEAEALLIPSDVVVDTPLAVSGSITLKGAKYAIPASSGKRASDVIAEDETLFVEAVSCEKDADVTIQGVAFTEKSLVGVGEAKSVTFKNCVFTGMTAGTEKQYLVKGNGFSTENVPSVKVNFDGCYFGSNGDDKSNAIYNGMELNFNLANGSVIKNCYFSKDFVSHNAINIYGIEDGAIVKILNNHFEMSANAIRIGLVGEPTGKILIENNTYDETDPDPAYAGLMLIQPYGTKTISMAGVRIDINKTKKPEGQLFYCYFSSKSTQMNSSLWPKVYVDGKKQLLTLGDDAVAEEQKPTEGATI